MKSWLRTLGLTALLAGSVLANEVELVSHESLHYASQPFSLLLMKLD